MKEKNEVLKLVDRVKKAMDEKEAKGDFERNTIKWKGFSETEKSLIKQSMESCWKRGDIKNKQLARLMLKSLGSSMSDSEE